MRNVVVYDKRTNKELGEFEHLPDGEEDLRTVLKKEIGYGSMRLRWKDRKRKDGKYVEFPRQRLVLILEPLGARNDSAPVRAGLPAIAQAIEGMQGGDSLVVKLILEKIDQNNQEILRRIDTVMDFLQEEEAEDAADMGGMPVPTEGETIDAMGVLKSVLKDPAYSGLIGGVMANVSNPDAMNQAIKTEMDKNPALLSGIFAKFLPLMLEGV